MLGCPEEDREETGKGALNEKVEEDGSSPLGLGLLLCNRIWVGCGRLG